METTLAERKERRAEAQSREATAKGAVQVLESHLLEDLRAPGMLSTQIERAIQNLADLERELQEARTAREARSSLCQEARANLDAHRVAITQASARTAEGLLALDEALAEARFWERRDFERACQSQGAQEALEQEIRTHSEALAAAEDRYQRALAQAGSDPPPTSALSRLPLIGR